MHSPSSHISPVTSHVTPSQGSNKRCRLANGLEILRFCLLTTLQRGVKYCLLPCSVVVAVVVVVSKVVVVDDVEIGVVVAVDKI